MLLPCTWTSTPFELAHWSLGRKDVDLYFPHGLTGIRCKGNAKPHGFQLPSVKSLMASFEGCSAKYFNVTFGSPSLIIRCTTMSDLKTIVHVESRNLLVRVRKISAMPASPVWVAVKIVWMYFAFGAASCISIRNEQTPSQVEFEP